MMEKLSRRVVLGALAATAWPLRAANDPAPKSFELDAGGGRKSSISQWPAKGRKRGTILFSHGAFSAPRFYTELYAAWTAAGFEVLAPLHVDSREHPETAKYPAMASWKARIEDMRALSAHVGKSYVAAGHSYGGLVALTLTGATPTPPEGLALPLRDSKAKAAIAFSPPGPMPGLISNEGYASIAAPAFIQTGTRDVPPGPPGVPVDPEGWRGHLAPYEAAATGGDRYALVLDGVDHYFGGAICRPDVPGPQQLSQLAEAARLSTLFLRGFGLADRKSLAALNAKLSNEGPVTLLHK